jgi:molybdate transport system substrate-binding protein
MHTLPILALLTFGLPVGLRAPAEPRLLGSRVPTQPGALTVYAAASLAESFGELGRIFESRHAGITVRFSFAGSQQLAFQVEQGAPADVFASADRRWMDYVKDKGLVEAKTPIFARNRLVVIVPRANPARIQRLEDLARRGVKVVLAAEAVPAGKYTREMLTKLAGARGFPAEYDRKVLANVVSQEENVKGVVGKIQFDEADAGVVYRSDVTLAVSRYVTILDVPETNNVIAQYPIAVLRSAPNRDAAKQFVQLVISLEGQRVLQEHGLLAADVAAPAR